VVCGGQGAVDTALLAVKGNQATLRADVSLYLDDPAREAGEIDTTVDADKWNPIGWTGIGVS
jgi:hypothetical protein